MRNRMKSGHETGCWVRMLALGCLLFVGLVGARAYDRQSSSRAARLSYLQGSVSVVRMDNTGSDTAQLNMPLAEGIRVMTGEDGQAEIEFEDGSMVRLTPNSALNLDHLSVDSGGNFQTQLSLAHGLMYAELRATSKYQYQLTADASTVSPVENATIRVNLDEPPVVISVLTGTAHVERPGSENSNGYRTDVRAGETLTGDVSDGERYFLSRQIASDSWDSWNEERDQAAADQAASRTAARDDLEGDHGYGWSDLDANGSWYNVPGQGTVWQPTVAMDANFDPYGYGSWVWYPGAGYVWASGYGWGWTPFRCGNWSYWNSFGWGWMPAGNCGLGWGFGGGVYVINIVRPPPVYHFPSVPVPGHRPVVTHPVIVVHPGRGPSAPITPISGPRLIAGHMVQPLQPVGSSYTSRGGSAVGASLQRDFPMGHNDHQPMPGRVAGAAPNSVMGNSPARRPEAPSDGTRQSTLRAGDGTSANSTVPRRLPPPNSQVNQDRSVQRLNEPVRSFAPQETSRPSIPSPAPRPISPPAPSVPRSMPSPPRPASPPVAPRPAPLR
jgi:FecR protein